ncbi:MAG: glycosyltransferase family 1 protein [Acidobacteria bacterium]|nr:MAG: glycosyltransferase family 1 protein [Acidobacteriota bacterium]
MVISHPIQHYAPLFRTLAGVPGLEVRVFYCCDWGVKPYHDSGFGQTFAWDVDLLSGYDSVFLPIRRRPRSAGFLDMDNPSVGRYLDEFNPHALWLHGYSQRTIWRAARWASGRAALLHFGDSELLHDRGVVRRALKRAILRWHFGRCDAFVTIGDNNEAYYRHYGVPPEKMFRGACPVDVQRFRAGAGERPASRRSIRERFQLPPDALVALQVGKLEPRKRPFDLVEAVGALAADAVPVAGLLVGDGPLRGAVETRIRERGLEGRMRVSGFVNQREMPSLLAGGDILVVASDFDPHPLVVTEAMAVGLPIVASDRIGCVGETDSAQPGRNTAVFSCGDVVGLTAALRRLTDDPGERERLGRSSELLADTQDLPVAAEAVLRALRAVADRRTDIWDVDARDSARRLSMPPAAATVGGRGAT